MAIAPAAATDVRGSLDLARLPPRPAPNTVPAFRWELQNGIKEVLPDQVPARELAVVLTGEGGRSDGEVRVPIVGGELKPSTLVLGQGTTLELENRDEIAHELLAVGLEGFSAETTSPRARRSVHLRTTGNWPIEDRLVPHARGHLHVLADLIAVAETDALGRFTFTDIEPGAYTLRVFHGSAQVASQRIDVGERTLELQAIIPSDP